MSMRNDCFDALPVTKIAVPRWWVPQRSVLSPNNLVGEDARGNGIARVLIMDQQMLTAEEPLTKPLLDEIASIMCPLCRSATSLASFGAERQGRPNQSALAPHKDRHPLMKPMKEKVAILYQFYVENAKRFGGLPNLSI